MDSFTITKKPTDAVHLFHATMSPKTKPLQIQDRPMWFAHSENDAKNYQEVVLKFVLSRPIKLIDVTHQVFHMDFVAKVNNYFAPQITTEKMDALVALGLPDLNSQMQHMGERMNGGLYPGDTDTEESAALLSVIDTFSPLFGLKHRFSEQNQQNSDAAMVKMMMLLYPDYDGYTCTNFWPSYHHGGFLLPETCLFHPQTCIHQDLTFLGGRRTRKPKKPNQVGGSKNIFGGEHIELQSYLQKHGIRYEDVIIRNKAFVDQGALFTTNRT